MLRPPRRDTYTGVLIAGLDTASPAAHGSATALVEKVPRRTTRMTSLRRVSRARAPAETCARRRPLAAVHEDDHGCDAGVTRPRRLAAPLLLLLLPSGRAGGRMRRPSMRPSAEPHHGAPAPRRQTAPGVPGTGLRQGAGGPTTGWC